MINDRSEIQSIKDALDIVDVIGESVSLKNVGNGIFKGATNTGSNSGQSLNVDQNIQLFNDWSSGIKGDVFNWIAYNENLNIDSDFPKILLISAQKAGLELKKNHVEYNQEEQNIFTITTAIAEHYHNCLTGDHRKYIFDKWGITNETIDRLHIGYAPVDEDVCSVFDGLFHKEDLLKTGFLIKTVSGTKPFYQGRIVFPYWKSGKVVYSIARKTPWTPENKFEMSKYKKQLTKKDNRQYISDIISNEYFYGEDSVRGAEYCIITEGVTDCIMCLQNDIPCVSPVTVRFRHQDNDKLLSLVKKVDKVIICNDNEDNEAGKEGAMDTAGFLDKNKINVRLIELPKPQGNDKIDLAEYLRDNSKEQFETLMTNSTLLIVEKLKNVTVSPEPLDNIKTALDFIINNLNGQGTSYKTTFLDAHIKNHFSFSQDQIKEIKKEINNLNKKASSKSKIPLPVDRIEADKNVNGEIDIPIPYCHESDSGERGTFVHSVQLDNNTGQKDDIYTVICYNPTWLSGAFVDPETSQHYMELSFEYRNTIIERMVSQSDVLTTSGLRGLTKFGLNVPESKTKLLADFFATFIKKSGTLKEQPIFSRYGWIGDFFIYGNKIISNEGTALAHLVNNIDVENIETLESTGNVEGWIDSTRGMLQHDNVRFVCYAAATALVLKPLNGASFVMEQVGDTSKGKTITAQLAMSMFGNPITLKMSTSVTKVFVERQCALYNNLPQFLDETSLIPLDVLKEVTYMISNETSKGRGKKEGGVEKVMRWKTVLLTTGENPLINMESLGGQDVRTISLYGGVGAHDPTNVEYFKDRMADNYAVIGPLLVQKIIAEQDNIHDYYTSIKNKLKLLGKSDSTGVMSRLVDTYSLIALAGFIFESVMEDLGEVPIDAGSLVEKVFCDRLTQSDGSLEERSFSIVKDWIAENKKCFCENKEGDAGKRYDLYGNISMEWPQSGVPFDYVDIIPHKLKEILDKKLGHPGISNRIIRDWSLSDRIVIDSNGKSSILATIKTGMKQSRVIRLKMPLDTETED